MVGVMAQPNSTSSFAEAVRELWRILRDSNGPYRPERHYMRGPGPKWHAQNSHSATTDTDRYPTSAKARA
jgi:hypothetical protein